MNEFIHKLYSFGIHENPENVSILLLCINVIIQRHIKQISLSESFVNMTENFCCVWLKQTNEAQL